MGYGYLVHFVNKANYASSFAMELEELLVNGNIIASCQANISSKQKIRRYKQHKKNCSAHKFSKIPKLQNALIKFVIRASFYIFCALFSSFNVLSGCFYVSLSLVAVPNASISINFL